MKKLLILLILIAGIFVADSANADRNRSRNRNFGRRLSNYQVDAFRFNRFNTYGTATFVDQFGNIFEVDAYGNARLRGNVFRGFAVHSSPYGYGYRGFAGPFGHCR